MRKNYFILPLIMMMASSVIMKAQTQKLQFTTFEISTERQTSLSIPANQTFDGQQFFIIQFTETPTIGFQNEIKRLGVQLLNYIPNKAYYASCAVGFDAALLKPFKVHAIIPMDSRLKIHSKITSGNIPNYAFRGQNLMEVNIKLFNVNPFDKMINNISGANMEILKTSNNSNTLSMLVPVSQIIVLAQLPYVQFIEPAQPEPRGESYLSSTNQRSNVISTDYLGGQNYNGSGINIGLGDNGFVGQHIDFKGRLDQSKNAGNQSNHATYVAGCITGTGNLDPVEKSAAWGSNLYAYQFPTNIDSALSSFDNLGVSVTNNSIGENCNDGYTIYAQTCDNQIIQRSALMHIFSAGEIQQFQINCGFLDYYGTITGGTKQAKNVITVGSVSYDDVYANNSSRGPATDGRIEPKVVATGENVISTLPNNTYNTQSGTSSAAAAVTGVYAQLSQAYKELNAATEAPSALMKAAIMNGADDIGEVGPDFIHGFGRVNARRSLGMIKNNQYFTSNLTQGDSIDFPITIPANVKAAKIMLYWNDVDALINVTPTIVNDLDLKVIDPVAFENLPLGLNSNPNNFTIILAAIPKVDHLNNEEQVVILDPVAGTYTVRVNAFNIPAGAQEFTVVYDWLFDDVTITHPVGGESFVPGETEVVRWDGFADNGIYGVYFSPDSGITWDTINQFIGGNQRLINWPVPSVVTGKGLMRIEKAGATSSFVNAPFNIMPVPTGVTFNYQCLDSMQISWNPLPEATVGYQVWKLGANYMDSLSFTTDTFLTIYNLNPYDTNWFAVNAYGANEAKSRRTIAIQSIIGLVNCVIAVDAGVSNLSPVGGTIQSCLIAPLSDVKMTITNFGIDTIQTMDVGYILNGGTPVVETINQPILPGATLNFTFTTQINISAPGAYVLQVYNVLASDGNVFNDTIVSNIAVLNSPPIALPYSEDFETFTNCSIASDCEATVCPLINGMVNLQNTVADDADFRVNQGGTPTPQTGPANDHTLNDPNGHYIYFEASNCFNKSAFVVLPCVDLNAVTSPVFSFWYHMRGQSMGDLHLDIFSAGAWIDDIMPVLSGPQGNPQGEWLNAQIGLDNYIGQNVAFRFRGFSGSQSSSDMAIDDIGVGSIIGIKDITQAASMFIQPNPATNNIKVTVANLVKGKCVFEILDLQGRVINTLTTSVNQSLVSQDMDVSKLAKGIYNLRVVNENKTYNQKLVIQ
ncbi:MAG TPA: S8 family serine peptidase [Bacteroidia bacterium]|nr:S8 family serine peptidase [Bacteroidia bacterium]